MTEEQHEKHFLTSEDVAGCGDEVLSCEQVNRWKESGCLLVEGLIPIELINKAANEMEKSFPLSSASDDQDFGSDGKMEFPCGFRSLNEITLHPRMLRAVKQLLVEDDIRLTQSDAWPKFGKDASNGPYDNRNQRIHVDYPNHTLVHPPSWYFPEAVAVIVYFSDRRDCEGATAVVPRSGKEDNLYQFPIINTPGVGDIPWFNDRDYVEEFLSKKNPEIFEFRKHLYDRELYADYRKGTVLLYRHDLWHRGTPVKNKTCRYAQNLVYKRSGCDWLTSWNFGWARNMYSPQQTLERLIATASVEQRNCLGFPHPGHQYWNQDTICAVKARYGPLGMDMRPYE